MDVDAGSVPRHLGERGCEPGGAAILQRLDEPALDELERDLDQPLAGEGVADLHRRALLGRVVAKLLAREHARAADAVAPGRRAEEHEREPRCRRPGARHALRRQQPHAHRVDEAVVRVRRVEDRLAADGRHAHAVPVVADAGHRPPEMRVRLAEAQAVEQRDRPSAHGDDVAQDAADARRRSLERLHGRGMVVALDLERNGLAVSEVDHPGVLAWPLEHAFAG